jgi:hypothetical protein
MAASDLAVAVRVRIHMRWASFLLALSNSRAECLVAFAFIAGWLLLSAGIAALTSPVAWLFSLGLLGISLGGWKVFWRLITAGLYALTREDADA